MIWACPAEAASTAFWNDWDYDDYLKYLNSSYEEDGHNDYVDFLRFHIDSQIMEYWPAKAPLDDISSIEKYLVIFHKWADMAKRGHSLPLSDKEQNQLAEYKAKIARVQSAIFPKLRRHLETVTADSIRIMFMVENVTIKTEGPAARKIIFTSTKQLPNSQTGFFTESLQIRLSALRFDEAVYLNGDQTEVLKLDTMGVADNVVATLNGGSGKYTPVI